MSLSTAVQSRLYNWKFSSAHDHLMVHDLKDATEDEREAIAALARVFGNCGYFYGELASIVRGCVAWLLGQPLDGPGGWFPAGVKISHDTVQDSKSIHPSTGIYNGGDGDEP